MEREELIPDAVTFPPCLSFLSSIMRTVLWVFYRRLTNTFLGKSRIYFFFIALNYLFLMLSLVFSHFLPRFSVSLLYTWMTSPLQKTWEEGREQKRCFEDLFFYSVLYFLFSISISSWDQSDIEIFIWIHSLPTSQCPEQYSICMRVSQKLEVKFFLRHFCSVFFLTRRFHLLNIIRPTMLLISDT